MNLHNQAAMVTNKQNSPIAIPITILTVCIFFEISPVMQPATNRTTSMAATRTQKSRFLFRTVLKDNTLCDKWGLGVGEEKTINLSS